MRGSDLPRPLAGGGPLPSSWPWLGAPARRGPGSLPRASLAAQARARAAGSGYSCRCRPPLGLAGAQSCPIPTPPRLALNFAPSAAPAVPPAGCPCERVTRTAAAAAAVAGTERGASPPPNATGSEPAQTGSDWEIPSRFSFQPMAPRSVWKPRASAQPLLPLAPSPAAAQAAPALTGRGACQSPAPLGGAEGASGGGGGEIEGIRPLSSSALRAGWGERGRAAAG